MSVATTYTRRDPAEIKPWAETCGQIRCLVEEKDMAAGEVHHVEIHNAKLHYHERTDEFYYVIAGHGKMILDDEETELHPGVVVYIPRGIKHKAVGDLTVLTICIPRGVLGDVRGPGEFANIGPDRPNGPGHNSIYFIQAMIAIDADELAAVLKWIASPESSPELRIIALRQLPDIQRFTAPVLKATVIALKDKDVKVRTAAARTLGSYGPEAKEAIPALIDALADQEMVDQGLKKPDQPPSFGDLAEFSMFEPSVDSLRGPTGFQEFHAAIALSQMGKEAVPDLTKALKHKDSLVRLQAAKALGLLGPSAKEGIAKLREILTDQDSKVAVESACALIRLGDDAKAPTQAIVKGLKDPDEKNRRRALVMATRTAPKSKDAIPAIIGLIQGEDLTFRYDAVSAIAAYREEAKEAIPAMVRELKNAKGPFDQPRILAALGQLGSAAKPALPVLIDLLKSEDPNTLREVNQVLGQIGPEAKEAVPSLISVLERKFTQGGRETAIEALGNIGSEAKEAVPILIKQLDRRDEAEIPTLIALGKLGKNAQEAIPKLKEMFGPGTTQNTWLFYALAATTGEPEPYVAKIVRTRLNGKVHSPDNPGGMGTNALRALGLLGPLAKSAVPFLIETIDNDESGSDAAWLAVEALGAIGPEAAQAVPKLIEVLSLKEKDHRQAELLRRLAIPTLGKIGPAAKAALPRLKELAETGNVWTAADANESIGKIEK